MKRNILKATTMAMLLLALGACSDNENMNGGETEPQSYTYQIELTVNGNGADDNNNSAKAISRTLGLDNDKNVVSNWAKGDKIFAYNLSDNNTSTATAYSTLSTQTEGGKKATFKGTITSKKEMKTTDKLAFFYPAEALEGDKTVGLVNPNKITETEKGVSRVYHDASNTITSQVSLDMKQQDGTLNTIDKKFDYNWAVATLEKVSTNGTEGTITKLNVSLERKVTFWGMKFKDSQGNIINNIKQVKINGLRSYDILDLSNGTFVGTDDEKEYIIDVANKDNSPIQLQQDYVWVAFLAANAETNFTITVYTPDGIYTKTAKKTFLTDYDYRSNITMEKITPQPYVVVNNVKWATGNFIHYKTESKEYWGIAPAQWWISNYADKPTLANSVNGNMVNNDENTPGSQFWYINTNEGKYIQHSNDLDLFRWGDIENALELDKTQAYKLGTAITISGSYYLDRGNTKTSNRSLAKYGDIVTYWTNDGSKNYHYAYPTIKNLKTLIEKSKTFMPGYCYTDKGNKIYGAYFSDLEFHGAKYKFPTGRKLWKFQDVTGLVLANKGLFLPITGHRDDNVSIVIFRYMGKGSEFYALYLSDYATAITTTRGLKLGSFAHVLNDPQKFEACPIRPIYIGEDVEGKPVDAANFEPFQHIIKPNARFY
ncbi:hypothetical protein JCM15754A_19870 [Prevotella aurantiaca JCM 15754]|uniref:hypothetical protein n=1 Tax=Prevotella aurantiaca TaxID=596085 RepID=UPI0004685C50|nr:hypothetical protein [Prevotella aurantiaca]